MPTVTCTHVIILVNTPITCILNVFNSSFNISLMVVNYLQELALFNRESTFSYMEFTLSLSLLYPCLNLLGRETLFQKFPCHYNAPHRARCMKIFFMHMYSNNRTFPFNMGHGDTRDRIISIHYEMLLFLKQVITPITVLGEWEGKITQRSYLMLRNLGESDAGIFVNIYLRITLVC